MTKQKNIKIVDEKLILSLPEAKMPVVWQMNLEKAQSASFTVQEDKKEKTFNLVFKAHDAQNEIIASFDEKKTAVDTLMETSEALQNAPEKIKRSTKQTPDHPGQKSDRLGLILAIALVIVLILIWTLTAAGPGRLGQGGVNPYGASSSTQSTDSPESAGVPLSADDFLRNR